VPVSVIDDPLHDLITVESVLELDEVSVYNHTEAAFERRLLAPPVLTSAYFREMASLRPRIT
jgi:hypothetical protein